MTTPLPNPTPHAEVNGVLRDLLASVQAILGPHFRGMYLYGSLALSDFTPQSSDIDFLVVTDEELSADLVEALQEIHARLGAVHSPWGAELEGAYMPQHALRRHDRREARYPSIERGERLHVVQHDTRGMIQRHILREHGIALAGPPIAPLIDPVSADDLRRDVLDIAGEWLEALRADPITLRHRGYQGYTVLTICRMLYTLEFGTVVSKPTAARWAEKALGPPWAPLIARALADDLDETLNFIQYALDHVQAYERPNDP